VTSFFDKIRQLKILFLQQSTVKKILWGVLFFFSLIVSGFAFLFLLVWSGIFISLPGKDELLAVENPLATEVYSADSVLLGRYFLQERSDVEFSDVPKFLADAVVTTEDVRFYKHSGVDKRSLVRVLVKSIFLRDESSGGGSTLTQQLAKNLYPRGDYFLFSLPINKIKEVIIASRLEKVYDKDAILTLYLNTVPFGDNTYGIEAAAQRFFSVHASALRPEQAAVLVGMLKATYLYNPRLFPERSTARRNVVLSQMRKYGKLTKEQCVELQSLPLTLKYNKISHNTGLATYFREYIRPELIEWCAAHNRPDGKPYNLYTDGLKIYTTIDSRLQRYAEEAMSTQMTTIQKQFASHWGNKKPWSTDPRILQDAIERSDRYKNLSNKGLSDSEIDKIMKSPLPMNVFSWDGGQQETVMSPLDSIKHYLSFLQAGLLAIEPSTGSIKAWVGGIDFAYFQYDHVRESTKRQVGSTFKPVVYAAALEQGVKPCDFISAEKIVYANEKNWAPQNTEENYDQKFSMEGALAFSVNTVSVKVLEKAGINNTINLARKMGIDSDLPSVPSLALGVSDVSMYEMVSAYACFVNDGKPVKPFAVAAIVSNHDKLLHKFVPEKSVTQALSQQTAKLMVHMLKRTINEGTGSRLRGRYGITNDIAGKTGTTQSNADGWFMAMLPDLVIGCWVGADDRRVRFRSTSLGQGANTALPIVAGMIQKANADQSLSHVMRANFDPLPRSLENDLSCPLYKSDKNLLERIFGKKEKENRRDFNEKKKKKGLLKRLFGKSS
jgi:penicillin-binding protein 1A